MAATVQIDGGGSGRSTARMEGNVVVAVEQSLTGNTVQVAGLVVAHIISTSYSRRRNKHWKEEGMQHLLLLQKNQHVHVMMHDRARCNLRQFKRNWDSDNQLEVQVIFLHIKLNVD